MDLCDSQYKKARIIKIKCFVITGKPIKSSAFLQFTEKSHPRLLSAELKKKYIVKFIRINLGSPICDIPDPVLVP